MSWTKTQEENSEFTLQYSPDSAFNKSEVIYQGIDQASYISGLPSGDYYYRVRVNNGQWSPLMHVEVDHHSLNLAFLLASLGAIIFGGVLVVIIKGNKEKTTHG